MITTKKNLRLCGELIPFNSQGDAEAKLRTFCLSEKTNAKYQTVKCLNCNLWHLIEVTDEILY